MFGRDWEPAKARVKARRDSSKFAFGSMVTRSRYEYAMEISPGGGVAPFNTTMVTPMMVDRWRPMDEGDVVTVLYQPESKRVKWDRNEPSTSRQATLKAEEQAIKRSEDKAFDAALASDDEPHHRSDA